VKETLLTLRAFFVSLRLTVVLLILGMLLVFVATLDQVNLGIWAVQAKYFRSLAVFWPIPGTGIAIPVFPGGYLIGGFLLVNLIAAHLYRFSFTWKEAGSQLTHGGLILLLLGELFTGLWQEESYLRLDQGETKAYSESFHAHELVLIDVTDPETDRVVAVPEDLLRQGRTLQYAGLPFRVAVRAFHPNAALEMRKPGATTVSPATVGVGPQIVLMPLQMTYKPNEQNLPAAFIELLPAEGALGTWLVSPMLGEPQRFTHEGRTWTIALRPKRHYHSFALTLLKFSHDRYPGTEIPRNFSSRVRVRSDDGVDDREVLIFMNNPLRYRGLTFYQAGFDNNDTTTVLQVVRNPSWLIPYISCVAMFIGLMLQFGITLVRFLAPRAATPAPATS
jgi:hypothetical protein